MNKNKKGKKRQKKTAIMIISDIHLGSRVSRSAKLLETLKSYSFKKLILLGDIFEDLDFGALQQKDWDLLTHFNKLSKKIDVVWIEGNHDKGLTKLFSNLLGTEVHRAYSWKFKGKKYIAIHGHQFDRFLVNNVVLSNLSTWVYLFIQRIDFSDHRISRFIKRKSKGWLRLSKKVESSAIWYAKLRKADIIFCGHTHRAKAIRRRKVRYYNSGCWTDVPSTFITLDEKIKIHKVW